MFFLNIFAAIGTMIFAYLNIAELLLGMIIEAIMAHGSPAIST
jgi:hypothetical protein